MKYEHNPGICTTGNQVEVGKEYDYHETLPTMNSRVRVLKDESDAEGVKLNLLIVAGDYVGKSFSFFAAHGQYGYGGMARLFDPGTYIHA